MDENRCGGCRHYYQHYTLNERKLLRVYCGHCALARSKRKRPDAVGCERFLPGPSPEEAFVTKEYLSKELLRYMLSLELLPEPENGEK